MALQTFALLLSLLVPAQESFPLGPLGAQGTVEAGSATIVLTAVDADGPAGAAGLAPGDELGGIAGVSFGEHSADVDAGGRGPQKALGEGIDRAMAAATGETVELGLQVLRSGSARDVALTLPRRPALSGPQRDKGRLGLRMAAARQLLASQEESGAWDSPVGLSGDRVISAWALVALLAHGDEEHAEALARAARWLGGPEERAWLPEDHSKGPDNLGNWAITSTMVALSEYDGRVGEPRYRELLAHLGRGLVTRMDGEGRFGHDVVTGYTGRGFNVINTLAHLAWAVAELDGVPVDSAAWEKSALQIEQSIDPDGGVRYWTLPGTGTKDASLRTASMALALQVRDERTELAESLVRYLDVHAARTREAHAVGSLGMLVAAPALYRADPEAYERFLEEWRWYLTLSWGPGDRVGYIGGKGNNGGDSYLGRADVACVIALQLLATGDGRLRMHGPER